MRDQAKKMNVASLRSSEQNSTSVECKLAKVPSVYFDYRNSLILWSAMLLYDFRLLSWPSHCGSSRGPHTWSSTTQVSSRVHQFLHWLPSGDLSLQRLTPSTTQLYMASGNFNTFYLFLLLLLDIFNIYFDCFSHPKYRAALYKKFPALSCQAPAEETGSVVSAVTNVSDEKPAA